MRSFPENRNLLRLVNLRSMYMVQFKLQCVRNETKSKLILCRVLNSSTRKLSVVCIIRVSKLRNSHSCLYTAVDATVAAARAECWVCALARVSAADALNFLSQPSSFCRTESLETGFCRSPASSRLLNRAERETGSTARARLRVRRESRACSRRRVTCCFASL